MKTRARTSIAISTLVVMLLQIGTLGSLLLASRIISSSGSILYRIPEPGTPHKWLGIRTSPFGWSLHESDEMFLKAINALHPSVWQCQFPGDWWESESAYEGWRTFHLPSMLRLTEYCHDNGVTLMIVWGNMFHEDVGLGPVFLQHVDWFFGNLTEQQISPPLWFGLDTEWVRLEDNSEDYAKSQLETLRAKVEGYGSRFFIAYTVDYSPWAMPFVNDYPMWWSTNYPYEAGAWDGVDWIDRLDQYEYGFGMKIGILRYDAYEWWTEEHIVSIFDHADATENMGILGLDVTLEMLDTELCPDFISIVNREAYTRGYITSLTFP